MCVPCSLDRLYFIRHIAYERGGIFDVHNLWHIWMLCEALGTVMTRHFGLQPATNNTSIAPFIYNSVYTTLFNELEVRLWWLLQCRHSKAKHSTCAANETLTILLCIWLHFVVIFHFSTEMLLFLFFSPFQPVNVFFILKLTHFYFLSFLPFNFSSWHGCSCDRMVLFFSVFVSVWATIQSRCHWIMSFILV